MTTEATVATAEALIPLMQRHWGYDRYLPDQEAAVAHVLA
jgi:hypothetical protein